MYFHYYKYNKKWKLKWSVEQGKLTVDNNEGLFEIIFDDIEHIEQVRAYPFAEKRAPAARSMALFVVCNYKSL